ncbi:MAG: nucleoside hydrolase, partial [Acidimicrobiia bacterium]
MFLVAALAAVACTPGASPSTTANRATSPSASEVESEGQGRQPVIVDYSPTVSDVGALLYLLSHPDVDVLAVTLPVTGEAGCELGVEVTFGILALLGRAEVPVACDSEPALGAGEWPAAFLTGHESLGFGLPDVSGVGADPRPAHQLIADVAAASDQPVTLYAVAPLTNVARALDLHPNVADQLDRVVIMGGAVDARGNVGVDAPVPLGVTDAEWNFWIDVPAAARVLGSGAQIALVPLDATNHVPVPAFWLLDLQEAEQSEAVKYLGSLVRIFPAVTSGFFYLWDELAASVAAGENLVTTEPINLVVVEEPGPMYGSTVRDPSGARVLVATAVPDPAAFYAHFLTTLSGAPVKVRARLLFDEASAPGSVTASS